MTMNYEVTDSDTDKRYLELIIKGGDACSMYDVTLFYFCMKYTVVVIMK